MEKEGATKNSDLGQFSNSVFQSHLKGQDIESYQKMSSYISRVRVLTCIKEVLILFITRIKATIWTCGWNGEASERSPLP